MKLSPLFARNLLVVCVVSLLAVGVVETFSASGARCEYSLQDGTIRLRQHVTHLSMGLAALFVMMIVPQESLRRLRTPITVAALLLLLLVLIPGVGTQQNTESRRWFSIFGMSFQPSEFAKLALLIFLASWAAGPGDRLKQFHPGFTVPAAVVLISVFLVLVEVDKGTAVFILILGAGVLVVAGARLRFFVPVGVGVLLLGLLALGVAALFAPGRVNRELCQTRDRVEIVLNNLRPEDERKDLGGKNWQLDQSMIALTEGGWTGTGPGKGKQQLFFLPESDSDFIFAIIGQELGFLGASLVVLLFALFVLCGFSIALAAADRFSALLTIGLTGWIGLQAFINIGVVTGSLFQTGIALPFITRGGTAMIVCLAAVGVIVGVANRTVSRRCTRPPVKERKAKTLRRKKPVVARDFALKS